MNLIGIIINASAWFLAWLFAIAALHKLAPANAAYYTEVVRAYRIVPSELALRIPILIGAVELVISIMLVLPVMRLYGTVAAGLLLGIYLGLILIQIGRGNTDQACGCSASFARDITISTGLVYRNILLCLLAWFCCMPVTPVESGLSGLLLSMVLAFLMIVIYASVEQLLSNSHKLANLNLRPANH